MQTSYVAANMTSYFKYNASRYQFLKKIVPHSDLQCDARMHQPVLHPAAEVFILLQLLSTNYV